MAITNQKRVGKAMELLKDGPTSARLFRNFDVVGQEVEKWGGRGRSCKMARWRKAEEGMGSPARFL